MVADLRWRKPQVGVEKRGAVRAQVVVDLVTDMDRLDLGGPLVKLQIGDVV